MIVPSREMVKTEAARHLLQTLFRGSVSDAVTALLDASDRQLTDADAAEIRRLIAQAEAEGR